MGNPPLSYHNGYVKQDFSRCDTISEFVLRLNEICHGQYGHNHEETNNITNDEAGMNVKDSLSGFYQGPTNARFIVSATLVDLLDK